MQKVCVVFGPTASGKSSVAIALAHLLDGEVVSADSMQLYRGLDIGTAKVTEEEMQGILHHMIDILEPSQKFSVAEFKSQALLVIADILARGKTPIVCGGTGLYLDALVRNISFDETPHESPLREELFAEHAQKGNVWMHAKLEALDPASASAIHANNVKRVIRALEVTLQTGIPFSKQKQTAVELPSPYQFQLFGLVHKREVLYARIDSRVDLMFAQGLLEEASKFMQDGFASETTAAQAIGYKELIAFFEGKQTIEEAKERIKMETRRYAKRQITWMKRYTDAFWIDCLDLRAEEIAQLIVKAF